MVGQRIGGYELRELLGEGGMGAVYLAHHSLIGRKAAIKLLRRELATDKSMVERFINEARAANAIGHPGIVDVIDAGILPDGVPFLVMEYLEGENLRGRLVREDRLSIDTAVIYAADCAAALQAAHEKGIVHRDLKPENLFLVAPPNPEGAERLKVLDFGIAKLQLAQEPGAHKTRPGAIMGTPHYMSPEQCRGQPDSIGPASDIYSLGIILYEMVTGNVPFAGVGDGGIIALHIMTPPERPGVRRPGLPPQLESAILRALAKRPEDRFASMADFRSALLGRAPSIAPALRTPDPRAAKPVPTPSRAALAGKTTLSAATRETVRVTRHRGRSGAIALGAAALAIGAVMGFLSLRDRAARPAAVEPAVAAARAPATAAPVAPAPTAISVAPPAVDAGSTAAASAPAARVWPAPPTGAIKPIPRKKVAAPKPGPAAPVAPGPAPAEPATLPEPAPPTPPPPPEKW